MEQLGSDFALGALSALGGLLSGFWSLLPWEAQVGLAIAAAVGLAILVKLLRDAGGWPLVVGFLLAVVGLVSGSVGFHKGAAWAARRKPAVVPKKRRKTLF